MSQQKSKDQTKPKKKEPRVWVAVVLVTLVAGALTALQIIRQQAPGKHVAITPQPISQMTEQALKDTAWDSAWPPLPDAGTPAQPLDQVRAMYAFAARHPEVMQYAPCYCGCEAQDHKSARDCFVKGRTTDGKPQWDGMGFT